MFKSRQVKFKTTQYWNISFGNIQLMNKFKSLIYDAFGDEVAWEELKGLDSFTLEIKELPNKYVDKVEKFVKQTRIKD